MRYLVALLLFTLSVNLTAQKYIIKGKVKDSKNEQPLSFANLRIDKSTLGSAANFEGAYELRLEAGSYRIIASVLGYKSDTLSINLQSNVIHNFNLEQVSIRLNEITVFPGENPALEIIRRAIESKHERNKKLDSYEFNAYTKGIVKTTKDFKASGQSATLSIGERDTAKLKITGIIENESIGYFKKPSLYKDEIVARKQSANTPPAINILTGGRLLQNFYTDDIKFFDRPLLSPIADDALEFYYYIIEDTIAIDNRNVFQISFEPIDRSDPGFYGKVFIADSIFSLVKIDVHLTDAANPGKIFNKVNILQQFAPFYQNIYMPIDYRIFVEGNFLGLAKFGFELNSIFFDYKINPGLDNDFFGRLVVKVLPDADKKDSTYWESTQTIPNSFAEIDAYRRIDSLESIPFSAWDNFSLLSFNVKLNNVFSVYGPLRLYSFNRVEGHALNFGGSAINLLDKRLVLSAEMSYGFANKKLNSGITSRFSFGEYRTHNISFSANNSIVDLFNESMRFSRLTSTITSWLGKYDDRDYHYTKGFNLKYFGEVSEVLFVGLGLFNRTDKSAINGSDFSIINKSKIYRENKSIYDARLSGVSANFRLDFRNFIEDGYSRRRVSFGEPFLILAGDLIFSNNSLLKSDLDFELYRLTLNGYVPTIKSYPFSFIVTGIYSGGTVPFQMMYALPASVESASQNFVYRTLRPAEIFGDRILSLSAEQSLGDIPVRWIGSNIINELQFNFGIHFGAAVTSVSEKSQTILSHQFIEYKHPFYELGFSIGQALYPIRFEFTWKLNYFGNTNFSFDINSPLF